MAAIVRTQLQQKAINKVTGVMQDYPLGIEFGELMQKTGYKKSALYNVLSMVGASKSDEGLWHLPHSNTSDAPVNEATEDDLDDLATSIEQPVMQETAGSLQDDTENMQDEELNTQAPQVSSPDNDEVTLINTPATLVNTSAEVVNPSDIDTDADQSSNGQAIETAPVSASSDASLIDEGAKSDTRQANLFWSKDKVYCPMFGGEIFELEINTSHTGSAYPNAISGIGFTREGQWNTTGAVMLYHATKENYQLLCQKYPELKFELPELVGSDLMHKILEDDEVWLCQVGDDGDENCTDANIRLVTGYTEGKGFYTVGFGSLSFKNAVPVNVRGQPISESDVFGAA